MHVSILSKPFKRVHVLNDIWREMIDFWKDAVLMVLAY